MKKIFSIFLVAVTLCMAFSCNTVADKFQYGKDVIMVTGTDYSPLGEVVVGSSFPVPYSFSVSATGPVEEDTQVKIAYDAAAVDAYNAKNGTKFVAVPEDAVALEEDVLLIAKGQVASAPISVNLLNSDFVEAGKVYVIPVSIMAVETGSLEILDVSRTLFIRLKTSLNFYSARITSANASCEYHFDEEHQIDLNTWTVEIKIKPDNLKSNGSEQICRVCAFKGDGQVLFRINENGTPWKTMHIVTPGSKFYTSEEMLLDTDHWFHFAVACDGNSITTYINGVQAAQIAAGKEAMKFTKFELGMAYGNYMNSQLYTGRLSEFRLWNRALTRSEVNEGLCSIAADAEGLCAYWRIDEGSGGVFHDATGNGFDMDFSKGKREPSDNNYSSYDGGRYIQWVRDALNTCNM